LKKVAQNILLIVGSLLFAFIALELGLRIADGEYRFIRFLGEERTLFKSAYPSQYDPLLGWVPREGRTKGENVWGKTVTILSHSVRSNGTPVDATPDHPILAVGDSFTFGDQVSDSETWPAQLEQRLGRPVVNGGVFGYGLDQSFLRATLLAEIYRPETLILGLIPDDIERCELSARQGASKPYFVVAGDRLRLRNLPVPKPTHEELRASFREPLSRSYLIHRLMMRCCPHWWLMGVTWATFYSAHRIHDQGDAVACRILAELDAFSKRAGIKRILVLVQYTRNPSPENLDRIEKLKDGCVKGRRVRVLDLKGPLDEVRQNDPDRYARFFDRHMTAEGNAFVAARIAEALQEPWEKP
jgi:hypothetical protein